MLTQLKVYKFKPKFSLLYITYIHKHKFKHNFMTAQEHLLYVHIITFEKSKFMHQFYVKHKPYTSICGKPPKSEIMDYLTKCSKQYL